MVFIPVAKFIASLFSLAVLCVYYAWLLVRFWQYICHDRKMFLNFQNCKDLSYEGSQKHGIVGVKGGPLYIIYSSFLCWRNVSYSRWQGTVSNRVLSISRNWGSATCLDNPMILKKKKKVFFYADIISSFLPSPCHRAPLKRSEAPSSLHHPYTHY